MIFVTVGTHEQPFNRLVKKLDELVETGNIQENVIIQTGFSDYIPQHCTFEKFFGHDEMIKLVKEARIVITHGGPSSFIMPLQVHKIPIVVPRQKKYDEHVNDHQLNFVREVKAKKQNLIVVEDVAELGETINHYDRIISSLDSEMGTNNANFNQKLQTIVSSMFE